jgi:hypothetical protein
MRAVTETVLGRIPRPDSHDDPDHALRRGGRALLHFGLDPVTFSLGVAALQPVSATMLALWFQWGSASMICA